MAARGAAPWIQEAVRSVQAQDPLDGWAWELRVGVDACEETSAVLAAMGVGHWFCAVHVGPYVVRNSIIALEPADAWATFDADDVMHRHYLATVVPLALPDGIGGAARVEVDAFGKQVPKAHSLGVSVYSAAAMNRLGGFRSWPAAADKDLARRASLLAIATRRTNLVCYFRRVHPASLTCSKSTGFGSVTRRKLYQEVERLARRGELRIVPQTVAMEWRAP